MEKVDPGCCEREAERKFRGEGVGEEEGEGDAGAMDEREVEISKSAREGERKGATTEDRIGRCRIADGGRSNSWGDSDRDVLDGDCD